MPTPLQWQQERFKLQTEWTAQAVIFGEPNSTVVPGKISFVSHILSMTTSNVWEIIGLLFSTRTGCSSLTATEGTIWRSLYIRVSNLWWFGWEWPTQAHIFEYFSPQLLKLFGKDYTVWTSWRKCVIEGGPWCFKSFLLLDCHVSSQLLLQQWLHDGHRP